MFVTKYELQKQAANFGVVIRGIEVTNYTLFSMQMPSDLAIVKIAKADHLDTTFICVEEAQDRDSVFVYGMRVEDVELAKKEAELKAKLAQEKLAQAMAVVGLAGLAVTSTVAPNAYLNSGLIYGMYDLPLNIPRPKPQTATQTEKEPAKRRRRFMDLER